DRSSPAEPDGAALPALAAELEARLGCAVLAMRYPVADEFAIRLAARVYDLLLGKAQPLCRALQLALPETAGVTALSVATPTLFGAPAADLRLLPPDGKPVVFDEAKTKLAGFPAEPKRFVGRVGPLARANAALAPGSGGRGCCSSAWLEQARPRARWSWRTGTSTASADWCGTKRPTRARTSPAR
ncbi:MAG: hypothetical protein ACRDYA_20090, partial [Egibacteraceae bacterium]